MDALVRDSSVEQCDQERSSEFIEGGHYARGSMLVAHIASDNVLAWLAGALARCAPVLECAGGDKRCGKR